MAKKKFDPKAKAKRQKMIAAVGGVLLLGLLAFQVPRTMKMLKQNQGTSSSTAATSTTAAPGSTPLAPPALGGSGASVASATATSVDGVSDPSNPLPPAAGQLVSFSKFQSKEVSTVAAVHRLTARLGPDEAVQVTVLREGKPHAVTITLGKGM